MKKILSIMFVMSLAVGTALAEKVVFKNDQTQPLKFDYTLAGELMSRTLAPGVEFALDQSDAVKVQGGCCGENKKWTISGHQAFCMAPAPSC